MTLGRKQTLLRKPPTRLTSCGRMRLRWRRYSAANFPASRPKPTSFVTQNRVRSTKRKRVAVGWVIRFSDDAMAQYTALPESVKPKLRRVLFDEWAITGPKGDDVRLANGIVFRDAHFSFGVNLSWLVPGDAEREVLIVRVRFDA